MLTLIKNLDVLFQVDENNTVLRGASLVLKGGRIVDVGPAAEITERCRDLTFDQVVDGRGHALCPGFIDTHVHLSETLSRAIFPDNLNTRAWVFNWAKPFYAHVTTEDEYYGALLGICEMLRCGTTCFLDMGSQHDPEHVVEAIERSGIRGITGRHAADNRPKDIPEGWSEEMMGHHFFPDSATALAALEDCVRRFNGRADGRIRCWVNIEGKEPCTLELHVGARALAERLGVGTTYHLATSVEEAQVCERNYGTWPVSRIAAAGGLGSNLVIAHCVAVNDADLDALSAHDVKVAFCPCSSLKLAKGASRIGRYPDMMDRGVIVGLGTDGVSASGNLNLMRQMHIVSGLFKDARNDPEAVGAQKALRMATIDAAKALLWNDEIGSIEVGKQADFVLFDTDHIEWTPFLDPLQALVYSATTSSIAQTWVAGVPLYASGRIATLDEDAIKRKARQLSASAADRAGLFKLNPATSAVTRLYDEGN
jgi:cytosine/adenosine deaminase-related metal-dependent hydrolase